ncbi:MAG: SDR family NAD(P)-dependent oxidoreductase, partial [Bacteroidales bacterium]
MEKIYVVTGGSSGIGLSCIEKLAKNPENHVISFSRSIEKIKRALDEIKPKPANIKFIAGDVTQKDDCEMLSDYIGKDHGRIHGLVHAAGVLTKGGIEMVDYDQWKFNLDVNLNGPYLLTQSLLNLLKAANG